MKKNTTNTNTHEVTSVINCQITLVKKNVNEAQLATMEEYNLRADAVAKALKAELGVDDVVISGAKMFVK